MIYQKLLRKIFLRSFIFFVCFWSLTDAFAQHQTEALDSLYQDLDSLFANESIPDLFRLADSLLALDSAKISTLSLRTGYVSQIVSAGRTFGFNQYGFIPGISYFHHSGFYGSATGYWSSQYSPKYYLTNATVGYTRTFGKHWMINASHDFYMYNDTLPDHPFSKSAQVSGYYQTKWSDSGVEYSFLYGDQQASRIIANVNGRIKIRTRGFVKSITLMPGASFQWGNANVYYIRQPRSVAGEFYQLVKQRDYPRLTIRNYVKLAYLLEKGREHIARAFLKDRGYTTGQANEVVEFYYDQTQVKVNNVFGFMNYCFALPVIISAGKLNLTLNYSYNIPVALPGETFKYAPNGYFSTSLSYLFQWTKKCGKRE
jgi:hypothetical protein